MSRATTELELERYRKTTTAEFWRDLPRNLMRPSGEGIVKSQTSRAAPAAIIALVTFAAMAGAAEPTTRARTFAALPDWTGLWEAEAHAAMVMHGKFPATPKLWDQPPYTAAAQKQYAPDGFPRPALGNFFATFNRLPRKAKYCAPAGFPNIMDTPFEGGMIELIVTPEQTLLVAADGTLRHIYTDGRPHPEPGDLWPTRTGDSIGHWEGTTLVIDTIAREPGPLDRFPASQT